MNKFTGRALAAAVLASFLPLQAQTQKYDIKSGVVTFEETTIMGATRIEGKRVVSFDDYGMKECRDTYERGVLKESFFSDGHNLYTVDHAQKTAYHRGKAGRGTELRFDWDEVSAGDKSEGKARRLPTVIAAGKECESFEHLTAAGKTVFGGWKHICLVIEFTGGGMRKVTKAIRVEENVNVPAEKFKVPYRYVVQ
jgi:hypothetical protein